MLSKECAPYHTKQQTQNEHVRMFQFSVDLSVSTRCGVTRSAPWVALHTLRMVATVATRVANTACLLPTHVQDMWTMGRADKMLMREHMYGWGGSEKPKQMKDFRRLRQRHIANWRPPFQTGTAV